MNRFEVRHDKIGAGMPHVGGDEPPVTVEELLAALVCPTEVGMNRSRRYRRCCSQGMPHVGGDEPTAGSWIG